MPRPIQAPSLDAFLRRAPRLFVLTGAGCSTASGIPDYRDEKGEWKHKAPVQFQDFIGAHAARGKPVAVVNRGRTRADDLAHLKIEGDCGDVLHDLLQRHG